MDITNFDEITNKLNKSKISKLQNHELLPIHPYRMLIIGGSGCGKTNILMNLIFKWLSYDMLVIISHSLYQPKYKILCEYADRFPQSIKCLDDVYEALDVNFNPKKQNLVVFDDIMTDSKSQPAIIKFFSQGRHNNISCIYLSQSFFAVPKNIRLNSTHYVLFELNPTECTEIHRRILSKLTKQQFVKIFQEATKEQYSFLYIDTVNPNTEMKIRKKFDQPINIEALQNL